MAKSTGKVQYIFVADSDSVKVNQLLAIIENPVNYEGYLAIDSLVKIDKNPLDISRIWATINKPVCRYGQLYDPLSTYMKSIEEYQNFKNIDTYTAQEKHINKKLRICVRTLHCYLIRWPLQKRTFDWQIVRLSVIQFYIVMIIFQL